MFYIYAASLFSIWKFLIMYRNMSKMQAIFDTEFEHKFNMYMKINPQY